MGAGMSVAACRNRSRSLSAACISGTGGGTKVAFTSEAPAGPIQFWLVRKSPGIRSAPRTSRSNSAWISRIKRSESGSVSSRASPWFMART